MAPYIIILIFVTFLSMLGKIFGKDKDSISVIPIIATLALFAGLRDASVGTDTETYIRRFLQYDRVEDVWRTTEVGYNALSIICANISQNYAVLLTAIAIVAVSFYITGIYTTLGVNVTSIFIFITLGSYTFFFNGARQGLAASICFFSLRWLLSRQPIPYFALVGLAATFHHTALVAAPLYFLGHSRFGWKQLTFTAIGALMMVTFLTSFVSLAADLFSDKYAAYAYETDGGGIVTMVFLGIQGLLMAALYKLSPVSDERLDRMLNIYFIGLIPVIAAGLSNINPSGLMRLSYYFTHAGIIFWPILLLGIKSSRLHFIASAGLYTISIFAFILSLSSFSNLVPYAFNSDAGL
ncbi:EpsG family protein [Novosphingobium panipatense]|uniref:EpsG family protein n=1 Tax=Novosphingobium panipatense TaxID=428991 RepID=A0ABY1R001_9SPHN|nr:EpsG family protein [Novosphingobium panipatense]SMP82632.1 EpsG family protein [Novosphingobium panipatense]